MKAIVNKDILRIIDANLNRSREGLRVCEEIARFVLNSRALTSDLKDARHKISAILKKLDGRAVSLSRNAQDDVGRCSCLASEMKRADIADIFNANMQRVKESMRVLEEFFKLIDKKSSVSFTALRFKIYEVEKNAARKIEPLRDRR